MLEIIIVQACVAILAALVRRFWLKTAFPAEAGAVGLVLGVAAVFAHYQLIIFFAQGDGEVVDVNASFQLLFITFFIAIANAYGIICQSDSDDEEAENE